MREKKRTDMIERANSWMCAVWYAIICGMIPVAGSAVRLNWEGVN